MRIWKVFSPASLPKPPGQPSLHSFHPQLSFQLLKRSGRERERKRKRNTHTLARSQRPSLLISLWGQGLSEGTSPGPDPYSQMYIPLVSGNIPESSPLTGCVSLHISAPPAPYSYLSTQAWPHTHKHMFCGSHTPLESHKQNPVNLSLGFLPTWAVTPRTDRGFSGPVPTPRTQSHSHNSGSHPTAERGPFLEGKIRGPREPWYCGGSGGGLPPTLSWLAGVEAL